MLSESQPGTRAAWAMRYACPRMEQGRYATMEIPLTNRLSFKQAHFTLLVAIVLGTLLSLWQIAFDYAEQEPRINREITALLEISRNPAARVAYNIDAELARELTQGLIQSAAVVRASLIDNHGRPLAQASRAAVTDDYRWLSDYLFGARRQFETALFVEHAPQENIGTLHLEVDTFAFGSDFLQRSLVTLISGFARNLLIAMILLVGFYIMLTKPLISLIRALSERDPLIDQHKLNYPANHERDEIGVLVDVTNQQLQLTALEIQQRCNAEDRLTQYLSELEKIVSTRTAELEAANTRLLQSNRELENARRTALEMAQSRSAFLANMSHEIRTPLNGLLGMLSLSLDGQLSVEQHQQLSIAHDSGKVLVELLNDILDLSKFDAGQLELEQIPFDIGTLIEDTASLLSQNSAPGVELTCLISPNLPAQVMGDPMRVRQIISNLLSNALKFTRFGRVDVRVETHSNGLSIRVRDTGIGIPAEAQARVFQPFTQGNAAISRQYGGTGLGLALTRRLCEAMQGRLELHSREDYGSEFTAWLPLPHAGHILERPPLHGKIIAWTPASSGLSELLATWLPRWGLDYRRLDRDEGLAQHSAALLITDSPECLFSLRPQITTPILLVAAYGSFLPAEQADALMPLEQLARPLSRTALYQAISHLLGSQKKNVDEASPQPQVSQRKARVLLVEDNAVNQLVAKGMLSKLGCEVITAAHGREALDCLGGQAMDLVLMDCNMPVMNGYEACQRIRRSGRWPNLPIIALTANALPEERDRCLEAGMDDYLAKPFHREELTELINRWLPRP